MYDANSTDEELMARYQLGSEQAFAVLYERHASKVLGYLRKRTGIDERAEELFQEVFVKMHKSKHLYNKSLPFLPWLFSVSRSVLIDSYRSRRRKLGEELVGDFDHFPKQEAASGLIDLDSHLAHLTDAQSAAVQLRYVDDKTFDEIATILGTSSVNARKLISRGVARLRELVFEGESHERPKK